MLPEFFEFSMPTRIVYGEGVIASISEAVECFGSRKAILVTDRILREVGTVDKVLEGFNKTNIDIVCIYDNVPPNSEIETVEHCASLAKQHQCDMVIGLGGGSVMDTAKVANIILVKGGKVQDHLGAYLLGSDSLLPCILIPTTAGTGSEVTRVAVIADLKNNVKLPFAENQFFPELAILDPELTTTMPAHLTATTGMDAMTHAIECYVSKEAQPASDALALHVIKMINENILLACAYPENLQARGAMLVASCLAGIAFSQAMVGMVHGISHSLGGVYHIPHGLANALVLPEVMDYNLDIQLNRYADIANALGIALPMPIESAVSVLHLAKADFAAKVIKRSSFVDDWVRRQAAKAGVARIRELNRQLSGIAGMPLNLKDAGINDGLKQLEAVVDTAMVDGTMLYNPREPEPEKVRAIVKALYATKAKPIKVKNADLDPGQLLKKQKALTDVFNDADTLYRVLGEFFNYMRDNNEMSKHLKDSNLCVQFRYSKPEAVITFDATGDEVEIVFGDVFSGKPEVTMSMQADFAHMFWLGKANILSALTRRQVKSKGNVPKAVKLLPVLKPAYALYPQYLDERGLSHLIVR